MDNVKIMSYLCLCNGKERHYKKGQAFGLPPTA